MPRREKIFEKLLRAAADWLRRRQLSRRYVTEFERVNRMIFRMLSEAERPTHPARVTEDDVSYVLGALGGGQRNKQYHLTHWRIFLEYHGSLVIKNLRLTWPRYQPTRRRWLNREEQNRLWAIADIEERMLLALELLHGLRRVEVVRLKMSDLDVARMEIKVLGKGRMGGKVRIIAMHPLMPRILAEYNAHRQVMYQRALAHMRRPRVLSMPDSVIVHECHSRLTGRRRTALDNMAMNLSKRTGIKFGQHDLRRTFGRNLYDAGVPIEKISLLLGHESIEQTKRYLGLDMNDMHDAMEAYARQVTIPGMEETGSGTSKSP